MQPPALTRRLSISLVAVRPGSEAAIEPLDAALTRLRIRKGEGDKMRFMIMVKGDENTEAGKMPEERLIAAMAKYHEELARAGVLLDASGLQPSSKGWRINYGPGKPTVIDGPFTESKELIAGYTIIQVKSREEALEWTQRFPNPFGEGAESEIEVRQMFKWDDFPPSDAVKRFRELESREK
jgi:hypothetical protein